MRFNSIYRLITYLAAQHALPEKWESLTITEIQAWLTQYLAEYPDLVDPAQQEMLRDQLLGITPALREITEKLLVFRNGIDELNTGLDLVHVDSSAWKVLRSRIEQRNEALHRFFDANASPEENDPDANL
jgi:hypothetical protein